MKVILSIALGLLFCGCAREETVVQAVTVKPENLVIAPDHVIIVVPNSEGTEETEEEPVEEPTTFDFAVLRDVSF